MTVLERAFYALYLVIAVTVALMLVIAIGTADAVDILPERAFDLIGNPVVMLGAYGLAFLVAPSVATRYPLKRR